MRVSKQEAFLEKTRHWLETSEEDQRIYSHFQVCGFICPICTITFICHINLSFFF